MEGHRPRPPIPIAEKPDWFYERTARSPDLDADLITGLDLALLSPTMCAIMTSAFMAYGGLHLLAWRYKFRSRLERYLWCTSAVNTASTCLVLLTSYAAGRVGRHRVLDISPPRAKARFYGWSFLSLLSLSIFLIVFNIASRAFLVVESFIALLNSPRSTYTILGWTAYIPHI